jgi:tetratricopeptide (TPR) repeat protein
VPGVTSPRSSLRRAEVLAGVGRYADAERALRPALAESPADPEMLTFLAYLLRRQQRFGEALAAGDAAVAASPTYAEAHLERAETLIMMWRDGPAVTAAIEAARLNPHAAGPHQTLARALAFDAQYERAREAAYRAVELAPASAGPLLTLAGVERDAGNRGAAEAAVREALRIDPTDPYGRWLLAMLDAERRRVGASMRTLRDVARELPSDPDPLSMLWPLRTAVTGPRWWLTGTSAATLTAVVAAGMLSPELKGPVTTTGRVVAGVVAVGVTGFAVRLLVPAGVTPWRCLGLVTHALRRAVWAGLATAGAMVSMLAAYAATGWWPVALLIAAWTLLLWVCVWADWFGGHADDPGFHYASQDLAVAYREWREDMKQWWVDTRRAFRGGRHPSGGRSGDGQSSPE